MKLIEVSEEEFKQLIEISKELNTQDSRATADPIWVLFDQKKIPTSPLYGQEYYWYNSEVDDRLTEQEITKLLSDKTDGFTKLYRTIEWRNKNVGMAKKEKHKSIMKQMGYEKMYYIEVDTKPKGIFLTEKACNAWRQQNKQHLTDRAYDFVESLWRNPEIQLIRKILLTLKKRIPFEPPEKSIYKKIILYFNEDPKDYNFRCAKCNELIAEGLSTSNDPSLIRLIKDHNCKET